jgi:hypothetical protein
MRVHCLEIKNKHNIAFILIRNESGLGVDSGKRLINIRNYISNTIIYFMGGF